MIILQALYNISYDILSKKAFISGRTTVDGVVYNELLLQDYADVSQHFNNYIHNDSMSYLL